MPRRPSLGERSHLESILSQEVLPDVAEAGDTSNDEAASNGSSRNSGIDDSLNDTVTPPAANWRVSVTPPPVNDSEQKRIPIPALEAASSNHAESHPAVAPSHYWSDGADDGGEISSHDEGGFLEKVVEQASVQSGLGKVHQSFESEDPASPTFLKALQHESLSESMNDGRSTGQDPAFQRRCSPGMESGREDRTSDQDRAGIESGRDTALSHRYDLSGTCNATPRFAERKRPGRVFARSVGTQTAGTRGGSPSSRPYSPMWSTASQGRASPFTRSAVSPLWSPPLPPSRPSTSPYLGHRSEYSPLYPKVQQSHSPEGTSEDISLCRELNQTRAELTSTTAELADAKKKLDLLTPNQRNALRRAEELVLLRQCPRGGPAKGDVQFRFVPACGAKEIVCSRKRFAGFEMPNENTKKLQRLKERMRDKEAECALAQRSVAMLKAEMSGMENDIRRLSSENQALLDVAHKVAELCACRNAKGKAVKTLWVECESLLRSVRVHFNGAGGNADVVEGSAQLRQGRRLSTVGTAEKYISQEIQQTIGIDQRVRTLWDVATKFTRQLCEVGGRDFEHPTHRFVAALLNGFSEKCSLVFKGDPNGLVLSEFMGRRLHMEEFHSNVCRMLADFNPVESGGLASNTSPIEDVMQARYQEAFVNSGGSQLVEKCVQIIGGKLRDLRIARGSRQPRQDSGYDTLGLDNLYKINDLRREKFAHEVARIAKKTKAYPYIPGLKGRDRARQKSLTKYGNNISCLTDLMRASLVYRGIEDVYNALHDMVEDDLSMKRNDFYILEIEDRFLNPAGGYRDVMMLFYVDGVTAEVQIHCNLMMQAKKSGGHKAYRAQREVTELIFEACIRNSEAEFVRLTKQYPTCNPKVKDKNGRSALHYTCQHGSIVSTRILVQHEANVWAEDEIGVLPCELALKAHNLDVLFLMLTQMYIQKPTSGRVVRRLVEHSLLWWCDKTAYAADGAAAALKGPWKRAGDLMMEVVTKHADYGGHKILESWFWQVVTDASVVGSIDRVRVLLSVGFDSKIDRSRASAMDVAIQEGHQVMVVVLRQFAVRGAECCECWIGSTNMHLQTAAKNEDAAQASTALSAGADPNAMESCLSRKRTPLMAFAAAGNLTVCQQLIDAKAQLAQIDNFRCNALHYARVFGHDEVDKYLLTAGKTTDLGLKPNQDMSEYVLDAVQGGCCGALKLAALTCEERGINFREVLEQLVKPFDNSLLQMAVDIAAEIDPAGQVARALLELRANPLVKNNRDSTPIHSAAYAGQEDLFESMIRVVSSMDGGLEALEGLEPLGSAATFLDGARAVLNRNQRRVSKKKLDEKNEKGKEDQKTNNALWLKVGFFAFQHATVLAHLNHTRDGEAASFFDILQQRMGSADLTDLGSDAEAGSAGEHEGSDAGKSAVSKLSRLSKRSKHSAGKSSASSTSRKTLERKSSAGVAAIGKHQVLAKKLGARAREKRTNSKSVAGESGAKVNFGGSDCSESNGPESPRVVLSKAKRNTLMP